MQIPLQASCQQGDFIFFTATSCKNQKKSLPLLPIIKLMCSKLIEKI